MDVARVARQRPDAARTVLHGLRPGHLDETGHPPAVDATLRGVRAPPDSGPVLRGPVGPPCGDRRSDPYVSIGWWAAVLPFTAHYRTLALGLGALAVDLGAAVLITSLVRQRLGHRWWRTVPASYQSATGMLRILPPEQWPAKLAGHLERRCALVQRSSSASWREGILGEIERLPDLWGMGAPCPDGTQVSSPVGSAR